ncbi:MAG: WYL domain-containing protein [Lachnospiraceae bacterium]|nr:WYL domain-containing protein [Lachnospiraceae bacterium]
MIFNEVYGSYYNVVAEVLAEAVNGTLSKERLSEITTRKAFGESIVTIPDALIKQKWPLIDENFETPLNHKPTMPLTTIQKMWLKAILQDPRIQLFEPSMEGLEDVEPLYDQDTFIYFDRYADGDPYEDIKYGEHFRLILSAIREHRIIRVEYQGHNTRKERTIIPHRLEYSAKDDKFRLIGIAHTGTRYIINLRGVKKCELMEKFAPDRFNEAQTDANEVVIELKDKRNALERAMLSFSDLEKETIKIDDENYRLKLKYRVDDETEIVIRILAFGPMMKVVEPASFVNLIKERLNKQKGCGL